MFQALQRELGYLREEICDKKESEWRNVASYRAYAVFTVCRILYSSKHGTIVSKQQAGRWAIKNLPEKWNQIILQAFETYDGKRDAGISISRVKQFIDFADARVRLRELDERFITNEALGLMYVSADNRMLAHSLVFHTSTGH